MFLVVLKLKYNIFSQYYWNSILFPKIYHNTKTLASDSLFIFCFWMDDVSTNTFKNKMIIKIEKSYKFTILLHYDEVVPFVFVLSDHDFGSAF